MSGDIMLLSNRLIYSGRLVAGSELVRERRLKMEKYDEGMKEMCIVADKCEKRCWMKDVLSAQ